MRDHDEMLPFRYFGLSSSGVTFKSSSSSFSSSGNFQSSDRYGGFGNKNDGNSFKDSYKEKDRYGEDKVDRSTFKSKKGSSHYGRSVWFVFLLCFTLSFLFLLKSLILNHALLVEKLMWFIFGVCGMGFLTIAFLIVANGL